MTDPVVFGIPSDIQQVDISALSTYNVEGRIYYPDFVDEAESFAIDQKARVGNVLEQLWGINQVDNISKYFFLMNVDVLNNNISWNKSDGTHRGDYMESLIYYNVKDIFRMGKNFQFYDHRLEMRRLVDFTFALNLICSNVSVLTDLKSEYVNYPINDYIISESVLGERSVVNIANKIDNLVEKNSLMRIGNSVYRQSGFIPENYFIFPGDYKDNYESFIVPLHSIEAHVLNIHNTFMNEWYINTRALTSLMLDLSTQQFTLDQNMLYRSLEEKGPFQGQRVRNVMKTVVTRDLYLTTIPMIQRAVAGIRRGVVFKALYRSPTIVANEIRHAIGVSLTRQNENTTITQKTNVQELSNMISSLLISFLNPNLTEFQVTQLGTKALVFDLTLWVGAITFISVVPSGLVNIESRRFIMNMFAQYLTLYHWNSPNQRPASLQSCNSISTWYNSDINRMEKVEEYLGSFTLAAQVFINRLVRNAQPGIVNGNRTYDYIAFLRGWRPDEFYLNHDWDATANGLNMNYISPIAPYTIEEIINYDGREYRELLEASYALFNTPTALPQPILSYTASRFIGFVQSTVGSLKQLWILLHRSSLWAALSAFTDSKKVFDYMRFERPLQQATDLSLWYNLAVFLSPDVILNGNFNNADVSGDREIMAWSNLVAYYYNFVDTLLGEFRNNFTTTQRFDMSIQFIKGFKPWNISDFKEFWRDTVEVGRFLQVMRGSQLPPNIQVVIDSANAIQRELESLRYQRGHRDCFYIIPYPYFFLPNVGSISAFYTNLYPNQAGSFSEIVGEFNKNEFIYSIYSILPTETRTNLVLHDTRLSALMNRLNAASAPTNYLGTEITQSMILPIIKVNYPCIVDVNIEVITDRWKKPVHTFLYPNLDDIYKRMRSNRPIKINGVLQLLNAQRESINSRSINATYSNTEAPILSADLLPLPGLFMSPTEYVNTHMSQIVTRKSKLSMNEINDYSIVFRQNPTNPF